MNVRNIIFDISKRYEGINTIKLSLTGKVLLSITVNYRYNINIDFNDIITIDFNNEFIYTRTIDFSIINSKTI